MRDENCQYRKVKMPTWCVAVAAFLLATAVSSVLAWAVNVDCTQRSLLIDVADLKANKLNIEKQLDRIEKKLDKLTQ